MPSHLEHIKTASRFLRGTIAEGLADTVTGAIAESDTKLLKFHGSYMQDDRDIRDERRRQKLEPAYAFMVRARLPGGVMTPAQWLAFDRIAGDYASSGLRITTRQTFQWHGIIKRDLKPAIAAINAAMASTIAACGDVNRNVVCNTNPVESPAHEAAYAWAVRLSEHLKPKTRAYHEFWLDGEKLVGEEAANESEPLYGATYLPRKFKIGLAIPPQNDIDVFAQDLALIAIVERGELLGFNVGIGGGMGATHGDPATYPRLADVIGFVRPSQLIALAEIEQRLGFALEPARAFRFDNNGDRYGWVEGHAGRWHLTLQVESGRLLDRGAHTWLSGMRELAGVHTGDIRLTCNQNLIIANVAAADRAAIDALVVRHGMDGYKRHSAIRQHAIACVALPTCGLAMAESERYLPTLLPKLEALLDRHGLLDTPILLRLSGCPNGCSRPYLGEIALVGRGPGRYDLRLGADSRGGRLNQVYRENVDEAAILDALDPLFARYAGERDAGEGFGDFLLRRAILALPPSRRIAATVSA